MQRCFYFSYLINYGLIVIPYSYITDLNGSLRVEGLDHLFHVVYIQLTEFSILSTFCWYSATHRSHITLTDQYRVALVLSYLWYWVHLHSSPFNKHFYRRCNCTVILIYHDEAENCYSAMVRLFPILQDFASMTRSSILHCIYFIVRWVSFKDL